MAIAPESAGAAALPARSVLRRFRRRFLRNRLVVVSVVVLAVFVLMALLSPLLPTDPYKSNFADRLEPPSLDYWLGTDQLGRDLLSRVIAGSGIALTVGFVSVAIGLGVGALLGLIAGFFGGTRVDGLIMRAVDIMLAFPWLLLVIAVIAVLGPSIPNVMIAIGITLIPEYARLVRSTALATREQDFVLASVALGASRTRVMVQHVLPHCYAHLIVLSTVKLGRSILAEAGVSYLGLGVQPPHPSWGSMISNGQEHLLSSPHLSLIPGIAVMLLVMALNVIGDGLRDALDPRSS